MLQKGKYRHFKGGEYEVLCIAKNSETQEDMVVYRALYGAGEVWVRPACMWAIPSTWEVQTATRSAKR